MENIYTKGCKQLEDKRYRLYENFILDSTRIVEKKAIDKLEESINGQNLPIYGSYTIKLWEQQGKNLNKRNYRKVFEKVIKENKVTVGLMNHPDDVGDVRDVFAVERNPRIIEGWLCVDLTFVGEHGKLCEAILQAGGPLEFSSSAIGDVDYSGDVLIEGFELERWADRVFVASNGLSLFLNKEDSLPEAVALSSGNSLVENVQNQNIEDVTILKEEIGEKIMPDNKVAESLLLLNIKRMIKDAEKTENLSEKKAILESALTYSNELTDKSLFDNVSTLIGVVDKDIHLLAEKGKSVDSLTESMKTLQEEKDKVTIELETTKKAFDELQESYKVLVEMYENKQYESGSKELEVNKQLNDVVVSLRETIKKLETEKDYFEAMSNTKVDADYVVALREECNLYKNQIHELKRQMKEKVLSEKKDSLRSTKDIEEIAKKYKEEPKKEEDTSFEKKFLNEEVQDYFNDLVSKDDTIKNYTRKFSRFSTLKEAQSFIMNLEKETPLQESKKDKNGIGSYLAEKGMF